MKRRVLVAAGLGSVAAAAGLGVAIWRDRSDSNAAGLWTLRLTQPGGGELAFESLRGRLLLLNFWATWCPPCVTEMPLLDRFHREHRAAGWQVVGVAVDQDRPVREFIAQRGISFPIALAGATGLDLARSLGNTTGGLPFSVAFGANGEQKARKLGVLDAHALEQWAADVR